MRSKKFIVSGLVAGFLFSLLAAPIFAGPGGLQAQDKQDKKEAKKAPVKVYIPKEVRDVMLAGLQTRQTRQDIPFTVFKSTFLPAQANYYIFLFLKMKNADLGYAAPAPAPAAPPAKNAAAAAPPAQPAAKVAARLELFLQFHKMENGAPTQIVKEVYIPVRMELDAAGYDPAAEDWYTVGYPLPPADYLVAVALSTHDLKKIGTQYYEVSLPDVKAMKDLDTTPLVFLKDYKQVPQAETVAELHRGFMRYSVLQITPTIDNTIAVGDPLDLFFLILGAQPNDQNKYDIECQFEVKKGEKDAVKYIPAKYDNPFISQPLPLKQTLLIKDKDGKESQTVRDLPAGTYTFIFKATDKISGRSCTKTVDFTVK